MRIHRRFLYAGLFLIAAGGVLVAADLGAIDTTTLTGLLRLWPFAIIAIGLALVVRRTPYGLPGGMLAAALPGLVLGGALAVAPRFAADCGVAGDAAAEVTREVGRFDGSADVVVRTGCGSIDVHTEPGDAWQLAASNTAGRKPAITSTERSLRIDATGENGLEALDDGRDRWDLLLPTSEIEYLELIVNAGHGTVDLPDADLGRLVLTANASDVVVDASAASVDELSAVVNVGRLSIRLPAESDLTGSLRVGGGAVQICAPPDAGLRVTTRGVAEEVTVAGLRQTGAEWQSPDYDSAAHRADLTVHISVGAVEINPIGGCP